MQESKNKGFTLIEILVVIGIIAVLAAVVLIAINPARQFAQARDSQRISNLNAILNAIGQRIADNKGKFEGQFTIGSGASAVTYYCGKLPTSPTPGGANLLSDAETSLPAGESNKLGCLVPTYIPALPTDPTVGGTSDTGYNIFQEAAGRVHLIADEPEPAITRAGILEVIR